MPSKKPGARFRICEVLGQEQLALNHHSTYKGNQANPNSLAPLIGRTGQPNQCLCTNPDFSRRSEGSIMTSAQPSEESQKQSHWSSLETTFLGRFGSGRMNENENRQCPLELFSHHRLCVTKTFFNTKPQHRVSWKHTRSKHWHKLDLILTRCSSLPSVGVSV